MSNLLTTRAFYLPQNATASMDAAIGTVVMEHYSFDLYPHRNVLLAPSSILLYFPENRYFPFLNQILPDKQFLNI